MFAPTAPTEPTQYLRRSVIYRALAKAGARFGEVGGAAVALDFGSVEAEAGSARRLGLADLSPLPRAGFKGRGTVEWLTGQGLLVPTESNWASRRQGHGLVARLAPGEVLILGEPGTPGDELAELEGAWRRAAQTAPGTPRGYPVPRRDSHCWFRVTGSQAAHLFAKLCGVDLRPSKFAHLAVAQTVVARLGAVIVRDDLGRIPAYHLLADTASSLYLWHCLVDAMREFDGGCVGLSAVVELAGEVATENHQEAVAALPEKRSPNFSGR
jgi:sarcosine oxidase subunit gamma